MEMNISWFCKSFRHFVILSETLTLLITEPWVLELWYFTWVFLVIRPFRGYHYFLPCDLDLGVWPIFWKLVIFRSLIAHLCLNFYSNSSIHQSINQSILDQIYRLIKWSVIDLIHQNNLTALTFPPTHLCDENRFFATVGFSLPIIHKKPQRTINNGPWFNDLLYPSCQTAT